MVAFLHAECPCGRTLRARPDQAGTAIKCWSCGGDVTVPVPDETVPLVGSMAILAFDAVRLSRADVLIAGALVITGVLLVPRYGLGLAAGLVALAAYWGYGSQVRAGGRAGLSGEDHSAPVPTTATRAEGPPPRRIRVTLARIVAALASPVALAAPWVVRNRGHVLPASEHSPGVLAWMALALLGWGLLPLALAAVHAHDGRRPQPPWRTLTTLARHPLATLAALLVPPLGLLAIEGLVSLLAWQQGQLPLLVADRFPPPRLQHLEDGAHLVFDYDGDVIDIRWGDGLDPLISVYRAGLRHGFTLVGTVPASLSVGHFEVPENRWLYGVRPGPYLALRIAITSLILWLGGAAFAIQARWLGRIAVPGLAAQPPREVAPPAD